MSTGQRAAIESFLSHKRLALVGYSTHEQDFSHAVAKELEEKGYELVPVNPGASEIGGRTVYPRVQDISPPVEGALVMTSPERSADVVRDCVEAGIPRVWLHRGVGRGSVSQEAVDACHEHGIEVVEGQCPLMFVKDAQWFHRVHAFGKKLTGTYPKD